MIAFDIWVFDYVVFEFGRYAMAVVGIVEGEVAQGLYRYFLARLQEDTNDATRGCSLTLACAFPGGLSRLAPYDSFMRNCFFSAILLGLYLAGASLLAQGENAGNGFTNDQLRDKSAYRQKTGLGDFTIGSHGLVKDEREQAKTGDLEVGRVFKFKNNQFIPNVIELETFLVNRVGSYEDSLYENLGLGVGTQLSLRKAGSDDKWFLRFAAIEPSEYYKERYGVGEERTVFELTMGRSYSLAPAPDTRALRKRLASYTLVARVPASALHNKAWSDANAVAFLNDYLAAHYQQLNRSDVFTYANMSVLNFIIQRSEVTLAERENRLLELHANALQIQDAWEPTFKTLYRRAITILLRDKCLLVFNVSNAQEVQAFSAIPNGEIQDDKAMDLDRMIETFLNSLWEKFKAPAN